ncbi:translocation and assembly module lipoprotein TamL [Fulvivirga sediminis]|uniref:BamA/TamA family outer membrane protein n=1 Tax=Fulvivirga sediminis TaxID=2803949 RepID=A0A937JXG3_9BACT|nr:BamA/TamA family outer membrane protein [Fulvivirga sediminis]MBL3655448.1 BamA/TamA family outer membrane protein [Fulvivirga sediminis]
MLLIASCTGVKHLEEGQTFYGGGEVVFSTKRDFKKKKEVKRELETLITPTPNTKVLGCRPKVWFYHLAGEPKKEKGFKYWMRTKLGAPPVLMEDVDVYRTQSLIESRIKNEGVFHGRVEVKTKTKGHETTVDYITYLSRPYRYDSIYLPEGDGKLEKAIRGLKQGMVFKKGDRYDLNDLEDERLRLQRELKNSGFYFFQDNYILFEADSTVGNRQVDIYMTIKKDTPENAKRTYTLGEINVFANYNFAGASQTSVSDTIKVDSLNYYSDNDEFRPKAITDHIKLRKGNIYTNEDEEVTIDRLLQLDVFKFVNVDIEEMPGDQLKTNIYLTPFKKKSIRFELQGVSKSNAFIGPNFNAAFRNRNAFGGAELYELSLNTGYEIQVGGQQSQGSGGALNSYSVGIQNTLTIPRFISPLNIDFHSFKYVPQTLIKAGFTVQKRSNFFTSYNANLGYGFRWNETPTRRHELFPIDIDFIQLSSTSTEFDRLLDNNPFLARSYAEQYILGTTYSFFYNSQGKTGRDRRTSNYYFNGNVDISGNLMQVAQSLLKSSSEEPYEVLGYPYSQFARADVDFRYYLRLDEQNKIATRVIAGVGYAFGNSISLPYSKSFASGGSSSLRAFRARSVGPGTFEPDTSQVFIDQIGDIKLEGNIEYRFEIVGAFKGAVFLDAGNIWTMRDEEERPGGKFNFTDFYKQIAIGTGFGFRFDADFFVVRLDLGYPLKDPAIETPATIRASDRNPSELSKIVYNIAIGYPF